MKNCKGLLKGVAVVLPLVSGGVSSAQQLPNVKPSDAPQRTAVTIGGTPALDIIRLNNAVSGVPLRFGNVVQGSETVSLNGLILKPGKDYTLDCLVGVIYLNLSVKPSDSLNVQYRYDEKAKIDSGSAAAGLPPLKLNLLGSGLTMNMGFGQTERSADGKVIKSNVFGTANNFRGKSTNLTGAYFAGTRTQESVQGGLQYNSQAKGGTASGQTGESSFLVQTFRMGIGKTGSLNFDYQDVSKGFTAFNSAKEAGFADDRIGALMRERGLKRQGMGLDGLKFGALSFGASQKSVTDEGKGIDTASYSVGLGTFAFTRKEESVERGFRRFQDLGVGDWQRLQQSQGIRRTEDVGALKAKFGSLAFSNTRIEDVERDLAIKQSKIAIDTKKIGFEIASSDVDKGFSRFEVDRGVFGLEAGIKRQTMNLTKGIIGKDLNLSFGQSKIVATDGSFQGNELRIAGKTWNIETSSRSADSKFSRFNAMQAPEMDGNIKKIAEMYGPGTTINPNDRSSFARSNGIDRNNTAATFNSGKTDYKISTTQLTGSKGGASLDTVSVAAKNLQFNLRRLDVAKTFSEFNNLMSFEQKALGNVIGLSRTDASLAMNLGRGKTIDVQMMNADISGKESSRTKLAYRSTILDVDVNRRSVDKGFSAIGQMEDAERGILGGLNGFSQNDNRLRLAPNKNIKVEYSDSSAYNAFSKESRNSDSALLDWVLDSSTRVGYIKQAVENKTPNSTLFAASVERFSMSKTVGKSTLSYASESRTFGGPKASPNSDKTVYALETKISKDTSLRTEQSKTTFSDGNEENQQSHTVSTQISKNVGVSLTDTNIDRTDASKNETRRDYGFWVDFGKGVKMTYGYARHLNGLDAGTTNTGFAFGQGVGRINPNQALNTTPTANVNGTQIGYANGSNAWDDQIGRSQAFSNFSLSSTKPFHLVFLEDCKFSLNTLMASDNTRWLKEDVSSSFESNVGQYGIGFQYKGQVDQIGSRAIDRTFRFKTDIKGTAPLSMTLAYKQRVLPTNKEFAIRDFQANWKPTKGLVLSHQMQTNPEGPYNPNIILGTMPLAQRRNIWRLDFTGNKNLLVGGQFDEMIDDNLDAIRRTAGFNLSMFSGTGSPLNLFYGVEQNSNPTGQNSYVRFGLNFEQKASKNQVFSLSLGNQGWLQNVDKRLVGTTDWIGRLNYQWRFK
jgi:hypothetical protein